VPTKIVVAAVFVLAAAAAGDAVRGAGGDERRVGEDATETSVQARTRLVPGSARDFVADGAFLRTRVLRSGREYLGAEAIAKAFPAPVGGPFDIAELAVAPDDTLVLAIYRFPAQGEPRNALEFWRARKLVGAFSVPPGYFGGGLEFSRDGRLVAMFSHEGRLRGVFDRRGRRVAGAAESFVRVG
jgi:hypothetical protein